MMDNPKKEHALGLARLIALLRRKKGGVDEAGNPINQPKDVTHGFRQTKLRVNKPKRNRQKFKKH